MIYNFSLICYFFKEFSDLKQEFEQINFDSYEPTPILNNFFPSNEIEIVAENNVQEERNENLTNGIWVHY